jgi:hypothetical protein
MLPTVYIPHSQNPTMPPQPTFAPTATPLIGENFCTFTYTKKITDNSLSDEVKVAEGCAVLAVDDFDFLKIGATTKILYVCTIKGQPVKISESSLQKIGLQDAITSVMPGIQTSVVMYSGANFDGLQATYTSAWHPPLTDFHFPGSTLGNDAVQSLVLTTTATTFTLPDLCNKAD